MSKEIQIIRKSNGLVEARYRLSLNEQRLVHTLLATISPQDEDFRDYIIKIDDLAKMFDLEKSNSTYERIQEASLDLLNRTISLPDYENPKRRRFMHWFSYLEYTEGKGEVLIRFDKALKPYLLQLKEYFTQYQIPHIAKFKGQYTVRFYELLKRRQAQGNGNQFWIRYQIADLRLILDIPDNEYSLYADFRRKVIEPSLKEIQEHSDLDILDCQYFKEGKKVNELQINAIPKNAEKANKGKAKTKQPKREEQLDWMTADILDRFISITPNQQQAILDQVELRLKGATQARFKVARAGSIKQLVTEFSMDINDAIMRS